MTKNIQKLTNALSRFLRSDSGMTLPLLAFSLTMLIGLAGIAVDTGRVQMVQSKLQASLDAAGLAAASTVSTANMTTEAQKYLTTNFNSYMGSTLNANAPSITANSTNTVFTLSATATVPTTFMALLGVTNVILTVNSQVSRAVTGLELVFVLDNTGSMTETAGGNQSKMQALQSAVNTLISSISGGATTFTNLWIGIVPFTQAVNIGTSNATWINPNYAYDGTTTPLDWGPGGSWGGCVDARQNGYDVTDTPPSASNRSTQFGEYYYTSDNLNTDGLSLISINAWKFQNYSQCTYTSRFCTHSGCATTCSTVQSCSGSYASCTAIAGSYSYASPLNNSTQGPNYLCPQQLTPMTNSSSTLTTAVNGMTAQGGTILPTGMVWGWRMLSPSWRGVWGGTMASNSLPYNYNTQGWAKAVVFVTDGEDSPDATYSNGSWALNSDHTAYWYVGSDRTGSITDAGAVIDLDSKTLAICNSMKQNGIYIYTIGLGTDGVNSTLLQSCATAVNYAFLSPSTTQLQGIFSQIGDSLSNLRVSK